MTLVSDGIEGGVVQPIDGVARPKRRSARVRSRDGTVVVYENPSLPWSLRILFAVITVSVLVSVAWLASGGSMYTIESASMCPEVCVGSLVFDRPLPVNAHVHVGETVTFKPPGTTSVYTHRVVEVLANGSFRTKGDAANIVDPWVVAPTDVRGVTVGTIWGLGWLSVALPFLAMGMAAIVFVRRRINVLVRREWDRLFAVLISLVPVWILKPLIRGILIASVTIRHGVARIAIVNTGLLPAQFRAKQGQFRDFVAPGTRIVMTGRLQSNGQVSLSQTASFHYQGWTVVLLVVLAPLWGYSLRRFRTRSFGKGAKHSKRSIQQLSAPK